MSRIHIDRVLETCIKQGASDIHFVTGRPPVLRLNGNLRSLETKVLDGDDTVALMKSITPDRNQQELQEEGTTDFGFAFGEKGRFRVAIFRQRGELSLVLRLIPNELMTFEQIGLPKIISGLCLRPQGLFLVTGPTGCGKTTTLACMINFINENADRHIVTVEDPIEYYQYHKKSIINQREVGIDVPTFSEALRRVLRQDPDVILVGELRDLETIEAAVRAAETGHLVFSTVHTTGCQGTITRIIDAFPVNQQEQIRVQLSTNLIAVLSQALCRKKGGKGRVAAYEFMVITAAISNLIRENKTFRINSAIQTGKKFSMQLMDDHLWQLYNDNLIDKEEMLSHAREPHEIRERLRKAGQTSSSGEKGDAEKASDDELNEILRK
ncbi:MAG: type IV pilus twitching motility protein PilT [Sedimentisphaerales bacterium]|nr:type IV pilus twitching motility protein PilT [Sedimentisphaerales bacterium]